MAMFTVYIDESYGNEDAYSVGGYVAEVGQWEEFVREWRALLDEEEIPLIHKANLENFWGKEYKRWRDDTSLSKDEKDAKRDRINEKACKIILRRVNAGFSASIKKTDWDSIDKGRWGRAIGEGYYAAGVLGCMVLLATWADKFNRHEPIDYVFEAGADGATEAAGLLLALDSNEDTKLAYRLGNVTFAHKKNRVIKDKCFPAVLPLQAADFIAYETYKQMGNRVVEGIRLNKLGQEIPVRKSLECITQYNEHRNVKIEDKPTPHYLRYLDREGALKILKTLDEQFPINGTP
jgi:hypothetical protein